MDINQTGSSVHASSKSTNAYLVFCQHARNDLLELKPSTSEMELAKLLAEKWANLKLKDKEVSLWILFHFQNHGFFYISNFIFLKLVFTKLPSSLSLSSYVSFRRSCFHLNSNKICVLFHYKAFIHSHFLLFSSVHTCFAKSSSQPLPYLSFYFLHSF